MAHSLWMPLYWGDYFADTFHFTTFQHGCYLLMIGTYWQRGGPLPDDDKELAAICRTSCDKFARYAGIVKAKFTCKDGLLHHKRIDFELEKSCLRQARASAGGRAKALLPHHTTPTKEEESKKEEIQKFVVGKNGVGNGKVTILDPSERLARFQKWLAERIPGGQGWQIVSAAADVSHPEHSASLAFCRAEAKRLGKGWPKQWPV